MVMAEQKKSQSGFFIYPVSKRYASLPALFTSSHIGQVLDRLRERFDLVLVDTPPMATVQDGLAIAPKVDGVVLVVEADRVRWPVVREVKERITAAGGNILGLIFNKRRYHIPRFLYDRL
jgi:Mrp family chromosome partitioning ATPase